MSYEDYSKAEQIFYFNLGMLAMDANEPDTTTTFAEVESICDVWQAEGLGDFTPIEAIMMAELLFLSDGYNTIHYDMFSDHSTFENCFSFEPQVKCGTYTVDFLITMHSKATIKRIVVECDGHDFHEKTKKQASHDKKRDRWFVKEGMIVLRFTGSEIFNDVSKCGEDITAVLADMCDEYIWQLPSKVKK